MIKLSRAEEVPQILIDNQTKWTDNLLALVAQHGTYKDIPKDIKEAALKHYRHQDIKDVLFGTTSNKCAFCESFPADSGNIEVEHFNPKSLYPNQAFEWNNFLPSCRKCNGAKDDHDTISEPIINPYDDNPEDYLEVDTIQLKGKNEKGNKTIEVCGLSGIRIWRPYADLLVQFKTYELNVTDAMQDYNEAKTSSNKRRKLQALQNSIDTINDLRNPKSKYSFFCNQMVSKSEVFAQAESLLKEHEASQV
ncbi:TIGR02646 family protein [Acinetobacter dispersus]|uniref:HNH endonuclease n=1 Tax=Acinetobacter dispersus TaxID=70348 RepID=UPI0002CFA205|nr:HNH endonuclease [Acinetobacter dispersus]ENX52838.1 TIGR02646 family protein [Acinetobacter dispersus]